MKLQPILSEMEFVSAEYWFRWEGTINGTAYGSVDRWWRGDKVIRKGSSIIEQDDVTVACKWQCS